MKVLTTIASVTLCRTVFSQTPDPCDSANGCAACIALDACHYCAPFGVISESEVIPGLGGVCIQKTIDCKSAELGTLAGLVLPGDYIRIENREGFAEMCESNIQFPSSITDPTTQTCPTCVAAGSEFCLFSISGEGISLEGGGCVTPAEAASFCVGSRPFGGSFSIENCGATTTTTAITTTTPTPTTTTTTTPTTTATTTPTTTATTTPTTTTPTSTTTMTPTSTTTMTPTSTTTMTPTSTVKPSTTSAKKTTTSAAAVKNASALMLIVGAASTFALLL